jgi:hypothetical protein
MALNFPNSPSLNQIYTDNTSGFSYQWNGTVWISFTPSSSSQIKTLDDFSASFNNSTQTFSLTSGGNAVTPPTPQSLIINLGGVIQDPTDDYSVAGSNITFSTPPASGLSFSGVALGPAVPVNTIPDGTVTDGSLRISTTAVVGSATTFTEDLVVSGDARVTGILTVGTSSITLNGITNVINVGTGVTINGNTGTLSASSFVGSGSGLTGVGIGSTGSINTSGIITATSFVGSGSGLTGVGIGSTGSINTSGIITATAVSANEFIGTGDKLIFSPTITSFSPTDGATGVNALSSPNIVLTYNQPVNLGVGTITLRTVSAAGTITESFSVGVSTRATLSNQTLTIDPTSNLDYDQEYYVVVPQGSVTNYVGGNSALLDTYNFTTEAGPTLSSVSPGIGSTNIVVGTNIIFTFNKNIRAGVGTITLRTVSAGGTIVESYDVTSSARLTFSTSTLTIDPTSNLDLNTNFYVVVPNNAVAGYAGINTYNFTTENVPPLGSSYEGGFLICCSSPTRWVVSPRSAEVSRTWYLRNDANTTAQSISGCTGWFVPTVSQLQNPGYCCRSFWGPSPCFSSTFYWSSTENNANHACSVLFNSGNAFSPSKANTYCVRAFRCVTY